MGLGDAILLAMLIGSGLGSEWEGVVEPATVVGFLLTVLVLGLAGGSGVVLRCMGAKGGLATAMIPLALVLGRVGLPFLAFPLAFTGWPGWDSVAFLLLHYLLPTTFVLLALSIVNMRRRRSRD